MLALLPTATANILEAMNTERITLEIQQMRGSAAGRSSLSISAPPSLADTSASAPDDDGRSLISVQTQGGGPDGGALGDSTALLSAQKSNSEDRQVSGSDAGQSSSTPLPARLLSNATTTNKKKSKRQLWDELAISCMWWHSVL